MSNLTGLGGTWCTVWRENGTVFHPPASCGLVSTSVVARECFVKRRTEFLLVLKVPSSLVVGHLLISKKFLYCWKIKLQNNKMYELIYGIFSCVSDCAALAVYSGKVTRTGSLAMVTCLEGSRRNDILKRNSCSK